MAIDIIRYFLDHHLKSFILDENGELKEVIYNNKNKKLNFNDGTDAGYLVDKYKSNSFKDFIISFDNHQFLSDDEGRLKTFEFLNDFKSLSIDYKRRYKKKLKDNTNKIYEYQSNADLKNGIFSIHDNTDNIHIHVMIEIKKYFWGKDYSWLKREIIKLCEKHKIVCSDNSFSKNAEETMKKDSRFTIIQWELKNFSWILKKAAIKNNVDREKLRNRLTIRMSRYDNFIPVNLTTINNILNEYLQLGGCTSFARKIVKNLYNKLNIKLEVEVDREEDLRAYSLTKSKKDVEILKDIFTTAKTRGVISVAYKEYIDKIKYKKKRSIIEEKFLIAAVWVFKTRYIEINEVGKRVLNSNFTVTEFFKKLKNFEAVKKIAEEKYKNEKDMNADGFKRIVSEKGERWKLDNIDITETVKEVCKNGVYKYMLINAIKEIISSLELENMHRVDSLEKYDKLMQKISDIAEKKGIATKHIRTNEKTKTIQLIEKNIEKWLEKTDKLINHNLLVEKDAMIKDLEVVLQKVIEIKYFRRSILDFKRITIEFADRDEKTQSELFIFDSKEEMKAYKNIFAANRADIYVAMTQGIGVQDINEILKHIIIKVNVRNIVICVADELSKDKMMNECKKITSTIEYKIYIADKKPGSSNTWVERLVCVKDIIRDNYAITNLLVEECKIIKEKVIDYRQYKNVEIALNSDEIEEAQAIVTEIESITEEFSSEVEEEVQTHISNKLDEYVENIKKRQVYEKW